MRDKKSMLFISVVWFCTCLALNSFLIDYSQVIHNILVACCIISYAMCLINWYIAGCRMTSIYVIFIAYAFFSNMGQSLLSIFPNTELVLSIYNLYTYAELCEMLSFQLICVAGLNLGTVIYISKSNHIVDSAQLQNAYENLKGKGSLWLDCILLISFMVMFYIAIRQLILRQAMSYNELTEQQIFGGVYRFASIAFGIISIFRKKHTKLIIAGWLFLFITFMISGTRSVAIPYGGVLFIMAPIVWPSITQKKLLPIWIIVGFFCFAFISIISSLRQSSLNGFAVESSWWLSFLGTIDEMGASARPLVATMKETQNTGQVYFTIPYAILQFFIPSSLLDSIVPDNWLMNPSKWINTTHTSNNEWGFSFMAEAYLNFRYWGCLFMILYGYVIALWENKAYRKILNGSFLYAGCFLAILCRQIFFARGNLQLSIDFFRPAFYVFIIWYVVWNNKTFKYQ